jgi:hypothetical protein
MPAIHSIRLIRREKRSIVSIPVNGCSVLSVWRQTRWIAIVLLACTAFGVVGACHLHAASLDQEQATHDASHQTSPLHCLANSGCLTAVLPTVELSSPVFPGEFYATILVTKLSSPAFPLFKPPKYSMS